MKKIIYFILFLSLSLSLHAQQEDIVKLYHQMQIATEMKNWDDAIALGKKVLRLNPQFAECYLDLGNVYVKKGQDVNSLQNAILNFREYLRLKPDAENATDVQTSLDKLEYVLEKATQKEDNRELLLGRWASTDGKYDKYNRSLFILDIKEFDDKLRIDIEPSSLAYSDDFFTKTVYIDDPNADEYVASFTNDKNYVPSQAKYDLDRQLASSAISQLHGNSGEIANGIIQSLINIKQEKDLQKKTLTSFELKINPIPNEKKELKCYTRVYIRETTPISDQIMLDTIFVDGFYKVNSDYTNTSPIIGMYGNYNVAIGNTNPFTGTTHVTKQVNLSNYPDKKIANLYKGGKHQSVTGAVISGLGLGSVLCGVMFLYLPKSEGSFDLSKIAPPMMIGGGIATVIGIPFIISGSHSLNKAVRLVNESIEERKNVSELKVGFTGNGIALALNF